METFWVLFQECPSHYHVDITSSPQGDGNNILPLWIGIELFVDITSSPQGDGNLYNKLAIQEIESKLRSWHYIFPARGWKHLFRVRSKIKGLLTLHLPRKGMETLLSSHYHLSKLTLTLHLPRKGMETLLKVDIKRILVELTLHLPRKGMETFSLLL